ncbi:MAG: response regulator [Acidimicrobiales bacterium]
MALVLVVDDEPDILLMLRVALEALGHDTVLAPDGEAGLARLADPPPVVIISARSEDRDVRRALTAGAVDYVTKPFSLPELVALIEEIADLDAAGRAAHRATRLAGIRH